jgi:dephospho-CoA kinase
MLAEHGAHVVDVDKVAQATYAKGSDGFEQIKAAFGDDVVGKDGEIDRRILGSRVFGNADELQKLTDIVWPLTRARLEAMKAEEDGKADVLVFEAAVLIEAGWWDLVDQVWVVTVPVTIARERLMARNRFTREQADARINSQMTNEERATFADVTIENAGDLQGLKERVDLAWAALTANVG